MEATLITRTHGAETTQDSTLEVVLAGQGKQPREALAQVPADEWASSASGSHTFAAASQSVSLNKHLKTHALPASLLPFGSSTEGAQGQEFATFVQGRQVWQESHDLREEVEETLRKFTEGADITEGYVLTTPLTDGFSGLTPSFLELVRDEFSGGNGKTSVWVTGMLDDASNWARPDSERSSSLRLLNTLLTLPPLLSPSSSLASILLPIQPSYSPSYSPSSPTFDPREAGWTTYFRKDVGEGERKCAFEAVRDVGLRGAGEEFREPGALHDLLTLLRWRGNTPVAHLSSIAPLLPADVLAAGGASERDQVERLKGGWKDWSVLRAPPLDQQGVRRRKPSTPFAQYSILRGLSLDESQALGPLLEKAVAPLQEPFSRWVSLDPPYPLTPSFPPLFAGLLPTGRPLHLAQPSLPLTPTPTSGALFGLPDPLFPPASSYTVQPQSIPVLSTLSTTPDSRYWFRHLLREAKELRRTRAGVLREFEQGEYGVGREGVDEALEVVEGLIDAYGGDEEEDGDEGQGGRELGGVGGGGKDQDEDWTSTEPKEEDFDFDLE
ncbi:hypothetical protein JCM11251_004934 [Rhodosporidiobolus azoricus]